MEQNTLSPINGKVCVTRELATAEQIQAVISSASLSQKEWQATSLEKRKAICSQAIENFVANKEEIAKEITQMMGRPIAHTQGEVFGVEERALSMIAQADDALATIELPEKTGFTRYIKRVPVGNVLVIAPWNYPYLTAINAVIPALLAGNSVMLKHSAQTPLCAERLVEAFEGTGLPKGVFQFVHTDHASTEKMIQHPGIDYVAFTGSVAGGAMVERNAAGRFIGVGLELGGKDPAYVRSDADLDHAVETLVDGAFFNSGQSCCGIERIYVHESVHDQFVEKAVELAKEYTLGDPTDPETTLGPLVKTAAADFVREQIKQAVSQGARAHIDEHLFPMSQKGTPYLAPQILTEVNHSMSVMNEESFGPVVGIQSVTSDEEAISLMNDSEFGLTASVFTKDELTGARIGEQIETGTFFVNRCDYLDPQLAWTGVKNSGRGCTLSSIGFEMLTRPKSFHIKTLGEG
ncbi:putative SUCCINATE SEMIALDEHYDE DEHYDROGENASE [Vibrio nigripulchritudo SO65]|uniref:aldehyde dehydrogenase family protein n=1 Tax=Vibrio nigripulchritudo TaxID=28173 RepID=UPI0003B1F92B|nr:aldehyde dehydrogenase family protein [Vibrio nigripulchritudo]CCN33998.1 putative SUCCINATE SEMIALDEHYDE DEHYDROGENASE [Vibrio nigripulchritudo AM115]CCN41107.1 putative SUCCINATE SEMIALDEHYDE DEHYDROGENASE [Vibrio nigripulchritudo FTn2]CCN66590.1 putative SUCCINATE SEMIALDEHYDE DEHYDROGENASE [Vibrio nigripulchritudo POn4]CCN77757.1 putative SUCCINATE SEMIALDEHYDE DEHYDROGENASE [Vibrio nigripulchritudo SO65]